MVDARREAVGVEERPFSRDFSNCLEERWSQKLGGAKGGAPGYIRRTATSLLLFVGALGLEPGSLLVCAGPPLGSCFSFALVPLLVHASRLCWSPSWFSSRLRCSPGGSCALFLWFSFPPVVQLSSCGSAPPVVQLVLWFMRSWSCERPGRWRRGLEAQLCRLCGAA